MHAQYYSIKLTPSGGFYNTDGKRAAASTLLRLVIFVTLAATNAASSSENPLYSQPIVFTENSGQWDSHIRFRAAIDGATTWFTQGKAYYQFIRPLPAEESQDPWANPGISGTECMMISATYWGANENAEIKGDQKVDHRCNCFLGNNESR